LLYADIRYWTRYGVKYFKKCNIFEFCKNVENVKGLKDKTKIPEKIAILRLDTDWYESSKYELEQMYDNVVTGGIIIFDDYYHWDGQRRATDDFFLTL
jgi:hypothetical protein